MRWRAVDVGALSGDPCAKYVRLLKRAFDIFPPRLIEGTAVNATTGAFSPRLLVLVLRDRQQIPTVVGIDFYFFSEMHIRLLDLCTFSCCAVKKSQLLSMDLYLDWLQLINQIELRLLNSILIGFRNKYQMSMFYGSGFD